MGLLVLHRRVDRNTLLLGLHVEFRRDVGYHPGIYLALRPGHQFYYAARVRGKYERIKEFFITIGDFYYGHDNTAVCWCFLSGDAIYHKRVY
jgi:hypothetical protein